MALEEHTDPAHEPKEIHYHLKTPLQILRFIGFWPPTTEERSVVIVWIFHLYNVFVNFVFVIMLCVTEDLYLFEQIVTNGDIDKITNGLTHAVSHSLGIYKNINLFVKRHRIRDMLKLLADDERIRYESYKEFQPDEVVRSAIRKLTIVTWSVISVALSMVFFCGTAPLIFDSNIKLDADNETWITSRPLPLNTWTPFDARKISTYNFIYVYQLVCLTETAVMILGLDTLFFGLLVHAAAQYRILNIALKTIRVRSAHLVKQQLNLEDVVSGDPEDVTDKIVQEEMKIQLRKCAIHHQIILGFCDRIQETFQGVMLGQFAAPLVIICVTLYQCATRSGMRLDFIYMIQYLMTITLELFFYCWFGNELNIESQRLSQALFDSDWSGASREYISVLRIIHVKSLKPTTLRALGVFPLNLEMFGSILHGAYSYFAVLNQMSE